MAEDDVHIDFETYNNWTKLLFGRALSANKGGEDFEKYKDSLDKLITEAGDTLLEKIGVEGKYLSVSANDGVWRIKYKNPDGEEKTVAMKFKEDIRYKVTHWPVN